MNSREPNPPVAPSGLPLYRRTSTQRPSYDPELVQPMREELTRLGVEELLTPEAVEAAIARKGTALWFVNSVCGCAAGAARPALALALAHPRLPEHVVTVFAGMEHEAVARARDHFRPYPPSSPQIALVKDGELLRTWQRQDIEGREAPALARSLTAAFDELC
ncbi:MAG: BrxA/BrxB family bacilliredoxin [Planctomycetota bacterium]